MSPSIWFRTVVLFFVLATVTAFALMSQPDVQARHEAKGKKYALLVGVNKYKGNDFSTLRYTERDVEELAKILTKAGYEVRLLTTAAGEKDKADAPTTENIRKEFAALIKARGKGDTLLLAMSGHGLQIEVKDPKGEKPPLSYGYFCPQDADTTDIKYSNGYSDHLILVDDLMEGMGKCQATSKFMLMDACRNEVSRTASSRNVDVQSVKVSKGVAVLFSCSREQKAWEHESLKHGVFFHFVIEGLRGKAKNEDEEVTWDLLSAYVKGQVKKDVPKRIGRGAEQTPHGVANVEDDPVLLSVEKVSQPKIMKTVPDDHAHTAHLVLIGVANYQDKDIIPRPHAEADALALYDLLSKKDVFGADANHTRLLLGTPDKTRPCKQATRKNILETLSWLRDSVKPDDPVIFAFFGAGGPRQGKSKRCYFASDSTVQHRNTDAVSDDDIAATFDKLQSKQVSIFLDVHFKAIKADKPPEVS